MMHEMPISKHKPNECLPLQQKHLRAALVVVASPQTAQKAGNGEQKSERMELLYTDEGARGTASAQREAGATS